MKLVQIKLCNHIFYINLKFQTDNLSLVYKGSEFNLHSLCNKSFPSFSIYDQMIVIIFSSLYK